MAKRTQPTVSEVTARALADTARALGEATRALQQHTVLDVGAAGEAYLDALEAHRQAVDDAQRERGA